MSSIQERVAKGAAWLDEVRPGWRDQMSPKLVNLTSGTHCILGQVFADEAEDRRGFTVGIRELVKTQQPQDYENRLHAYGFASGCPKETPALDLVAQMRLVEAEWRRVIHSSRVPAEVVPA